MVRQLHAPELAPWQPALEVRGTEAADRLREVRAIIDLDREEERREEYEPLMGENGYRV